MKTKKARGDKHDLLWKMTVYVLILDVISGATFSSRGFLETVDEALEKARSGI